MHPRESDLAPEEEEQDPILERIVRERQPGELESGMLSGSDDADISATERFAGDVTPAEALEVLDPEHHVHPPPSGAPRVED